MINHTLSRTQATGGSPAISSTDNPAPRGAVIQTQGALNGRKVGQRVRRLAGGRIELPVDSVELVVDLAVLLVGLDGRGDPAPVGVGPREADCSGGQQGVPVARTDGLLGEVLRSAGDVGDDLGPQPALGATADRDEPLSPPSGVAHELEDVP